MGWTLNDILINTRAAADAVGATMMDRPEWIDTFPKALTAIATLTNNNRRGSNPPSVNNPNGSTTAGAARPPVDAANPRAINDYGHIITWKYDKDFDEPDFEWDIFVLCGDPSVPAHGSDIDGDKFGSPDGIYVAPSGRLWIETDVSTSTINSGVYAGFGHNQMLCADPATGEIRRFLGRSQAVRNHRRVYHARRARHVRRHPAPGRDARRLAHQPGQSEGVKLLARRRCRRASALGLHRDHQRRRRPDRQLIPQITEPFEDCSLRRAPSHGIDFE